LSRALSLPQWRLSARIVALSLGLLLLVQAAVFSVVRAGIEQSAREQITQELQVGERVWRRLLDQNAQKLAQGAALLAQDFGFRSAVNSDDLDTIRSVLDNQGARIGASFTALIDNQLVLKALGERQDAKALAPLVSQIVTALRRNPNGNQIALINQMLFQFVLVPMRAPTVIGYVLMGFPIGQALVDDMRALSDMHVALINPGAPGAGKVLLSTLAPGALSALRASSDPVNELKADDGTLLVGRSIQLSAGDTGLQALLLRSFDEVVAPFRQAQVALAWITALGVVLFGVGSIFMARRVTTPLRSLISASEKLGQGDYETPMAHTRRKDEIGDLAVAFDKMRLSIGKQQAEIRSLAYWDRLTGLPNRARFREALQQAIERNTAPAMAASGSSQKALAVVVLDLDRFKLVNDILGFAFGDSVLEAVAKRLGGLELGPDDLVARLGGNSFAILLANSDADQARRVAKRVAAAFETPLAFADQTIDLSAAIGIACWPSHARDADMLLSRAEVAMYAAKNRTTGIQLYEAALDSGSTQTLSLLSELRHAVGHQELRVYLQPKITQLHSSPNAAEALIRWQHPTRGLVSPMDFIPFAEQTGFVREVTLWIFNEVASQWHGLQSPGELFQVAVNLSTRDLLDLEFPARLDAVLSRYNVPAAGLCLEITESAIMDDPERAEATLNRLHERGFKLSIDDFGTGYSSLAYLKRLPVDQLKIDKSFVMAMEKVPGDAMIVRSTIDLAHNLGLAVVAEGVENAHIYHSLKKLGCDEAQGYFISKPLPIHLFKHWRVQWNDNLALNRANFGQSVPLPLA
jgi:diguanylate cyclase (GGDEF)-like protein